MPSRKRKEGEEKGGMKACVPVVSLCKRAVLELLKGVSHRQFVQLTGETSGAYNPQLGLPGRRAEQTEVDDVQSEMG